MYAWRKMTPDMREDVLRLRKLSGQPWHGPPHGIETGWYHLSAACYDHRPIIGLSPERMIAFEKHLLSTLSPVAIGVSVWSILPNHYHVLVQSLSLISVRQAIGRMHGRLSREWNLEDSTIKRKCWYRCLIKPMKNEAHRWATVNYIHHNPVHHGFVKQWQEWPFSSARQYLDAVGKKFAESNWHNYPILDMGKGWDEPDC